LHSGILPLPHGSCMEFHCGKSAEYYQGPVLCLALGEIVNSTSEICCGICPNYIISCLQHGNPQHCPTLSPTTALHIYPLALGCFLTIFNSDKAIHCMWFPHLLFQVKKKIFLLKYFLIILTWKNQIYGTPCVVQVCF